MSDVAGLLHDPVSGTTRRARVTGDGDGIRIVTESADRNVATSDLSVASGGWDGRQVHLTWTEGPHAFALTLESDAARHLAGALPPALSAPVERILEAGRRQQRRGRRTLPLILFVFVVLPLTLVLALYLMRDRLIDAALRRLPTAVDVEVGNLVHQQVSATGQLLSAGPAVDAVRMLGQRLAAAAPSSPFPFRFEVLRDPQLNAFAAPGGVVVVHTGMLAAAESPDEVAGVLAHELVHALRRHSMRQMIFQVGLTGAAQLLFGSPEGAAALLTGTATDLTSLGFGRDQEREADLQGLDLLQRARLPASGLVRFFETLQKQGGAPPAFLSTHPSSADRGARLAEEIRRRGEWPVEPIALDWDAVRQAARPTSSR